MNQSLLQVVLVLLVAVIATGCSRRPLTPEEVVRQHDRWLNETVTIQGVAGIAWMMCTEEACDQDHPCCNFCLASLALYVDFDSFAGDPELGPYAYHSHEARIPLEFSEGGDCEGNNCEVSCEPLQLGQWYVVTGTVTECHPSSFLCMMRVEGFEEQIIQQ